jgi:flagellar biosynthetic protein FliQ
MTGDLVLHLAKQALETAMLLAAPAMIVAMVVGFGTSLLQAVTSIRDMTVGLVLKLACVSLTLLLAGGWMMQVAVRFTENVFSQMQAVAP